MWNVSQIMYATLAVANVDHIIAGVCSGGIWMEVQQGGKI